MDVGAVDSQAGSGRHLFAACRTSKMLRLLMEYESSLVYEGSIAVIAARLLFLGPLLFLLAHDAMG